METNDDVPEDKSDAGSESDLSDIDEAQFDDFDPANVAIEDRPAVAVDETNVALLGVHRKKQGEGEAAPKRKKEGKRAKKSRKSIDDEDAFSGGEELQGKRERKKKAIGERKERAAPKQRSPERDEELSPEESKFLHFERCGGLSDMA